MALKNYLTNINESTKPGSKFFETISFFLFHIMVNIT